MKTAPLAIQLFVVTLCFIGCQPATNEKPVYPITGQITVDGVPTAGLQIALHHQSESTSSEPVFTTGTTDSEGNVRFSTYAEGDGAPEGEFAVTVSWQEFNMVSRAYDGTDKLRNKYSDPKKTPLQLSVGKGKPNSLGTLELSSKR